MCVGAILIGWLALPVSARSKILDPGEHDPLLQRFADPLDALGIDVIQSPKSHGIEWDRPRLAPLDGYPVDKDLAIQPGWMQQFVKGAVGAIAAAPAPEVEASGSSFAKLWKKTPLEQRIFISFAREDFAIALKVQSVLEANNYVAFIYLSSDGAAPPQSARDAGKIFSTAGHRLVVDTPTSRQKLGVRVETHVNNRFYRRDVTIDRKPRRVVDVYGRDDCSRTQQARRLFAEAGAEVNYHKVDPDTPAWRHVLANTEYLFKSKFPLIEIDGQPIHADPNSIRSALQTLRAGTSGSFQPPDQPRANKPSAEGCPF